MTTNGLSETLYWDQAQVLQQVGLIPRDGTPLPPLSEVTAYLRRETHDYR